MHGALVYLAMRQSLGGMKYRLSRLKNPRYLVPAIFAVVYFWFSFGMPGLMPGGERRGADLDLSILRNLIGPGIALACAFNWLFAIGRPAPPFTRPEAAQLFVLPLKRRDLVRYRLLRPQLVFVVLGCIAALGATRSESVSSLYAGVGTFLLMNLLSLNGMAASLACNRMVRARVPKALMHLPGLAILAWATLPVLLKWRRPDSVRDFRGEWMQDVFGTVHPLHLPLQPLGGMAGAEGVLDFAMGAGAALGWCAALYVLAMLLVGPFEERAYELAETTGRKIDAMKRGGAMAAAASGRKGIRTTRLKLAATGPAWRASFWMSWVAEWRVGTWRMLMLLAAVVAACGALAGLAGSMAYRGLGMVIPTSMAIMLLIMSPRLMVTGMHNEMRRLPMLKSMPISGHALVRGKIYAGSLLTTLAALMLGAGALTSGLSMVPAHHFGTYGSTIAAGVFAGLLLLWPLAVLMIAAETLTILLFPAWMTSLQSEPGIEQFGRNLISALVRILLGSFLLVPPGTLGGIAVAIGAATGNLAAGLAVGGAIAAVALIAECEALMWYTGERYDKADTSPESA